MAEYKQTIDQQQVEEDTAAEHAAAQSPGAGAPGDGAGGTGSSGGGAGGAGSSGGGAGGAGSPGHGARGEGSSSSSPEGASRAHAHTRAREDGQADGSAELKGDLDELVKAAQQRDEYLALAQRTQADFENYRKRVARDSALAQERGVAKLAKELLPALDNLDRALDAAEEGDPLLEGVRLVRSELAAGLARVGVESFSPLGEPFDPTVHEAMSTVEQPPGGAESGAVVEVYQPGYRLGEHIVRPARVVVAA